MGCIWSQCPLVTWNWFPGKEQVLNHSSLNFLSWSWRSRFSRKNFCNLVTAWPLFILGNWKSCWTAICEASWTSLCGFAFFICPILGSSVAKTLWVNWIAFCLSIPRDTIAELICANMGCVSSKPYPTTDGVDGDSWISCTKRCLRCHAMFSIAMSPQSMRESVMVRWCPNIHMIPSTLAWLNDGSRLTSMFQSLTREYKAS